MQKTRAQIDELKLSWREDPTWDLADSEGFEEHRPELAEYQREVEHERAAAAAKQHEAAVQLLIAKAAAILPQKMSASMNLAERERLSETGVLLRMVAEIVLPLSEKLERVEARLAELEPTVAYLEELRQR